MPSRRSVLVAASVLPWSLAAAAQTRPRPYPFPLPRELDLPISFAWSGPLAGAAGAPRGAARLRRVGQHVERTAHARPAAVVPVSVGFAAATPTEIVGTLNRAVTSRAVVVLDPAQRSIGVVFHG